MFNVLFASGPRMTNREALLKQANEVFDGLAALGCNVGPYLNTRACMFSRLSLGIESSASKNLRLGRRDIPDFARLIRRATLLEKAGVLLADIDRMGKVIGWHIRSES